MEDVKVDMVMDMMVDMMVDMVMNMECRMNCDGGRGYYGLVNIDECSITY